MFLQLDYNIGASYFLFTAPHHHLTQPLFQQLHLLSEPWQQQQGSTQLVTFPSQAAGVTTTPMPSRLIIF